MKSRRQQPSINPSHIVQQSFWVTTNLSQIWTADQKVKGFVSYYQHPKSSSLHYNYIFWIIM